MIEEYVIWSQEFREWYAAPGKGLTSNFKMAHRYTKEKADKHLREIRVERNNEQSISLPEVLLKIEERYEREGAQLN